MKTVWKIAFVVVFTLLAAGIIVLVSRPARGKPVILLPPPTPSPLQVHVAGAVVNPGVYSLPLGSRVEDAVAAAGGTTAAADAQALNLAAFLQDGSRVYVPFIVTPEADTSRSAPELAIPNSQLININTATTDELDKLPDIGPVTAQAIIDYRNQNGLFARIQDIDKVPGIGPATYEKIKDLITVGY